MIVDTHTHISSNYNEKDRADIEILIGHTLEEAKKAIEISKTNKHVFATCGLYPHDIIPENEISDQEKIKIIKELAKNEKVIAIGECGFDFTNPRLPEIKRSKDDQIPLFISQIEIARELKLPIVIHSRIATDETIDLLRREIRQAEFPAVWHCFTENYDIAKKALDLGLMLSITGIITYKNTSDLRDVIRKVPIERIMLETDSPYLVPESERKAGIKVNSSKYVKLIAQEIAEIKGISQQIVEDKTTENAFAFFKLK